MERNTFKVVEEKNKEEQDRIEREGNLKEFRIDWHASSYGTTYVKAETEEEARQIAEREGYPEDYDTDNWEINEIEEEG